MSPPPPNGHPTTGELAIKLDVLSARVEKSEEYISETRKTMTKVEQMIAVLDSNMKTRVGWIEKGVGVIVLGILGMVGKTIWDAVFSHRVIP